MDKDEIVMIPFVAHESAMNRMERANKRLWIIILAMFIGMLVYLLVPSEYDSSSQEATDNDGSEINQNIGD